MLPTYFEYPTFKIKKDLDMPRILMLPFFSFSWSTNC